MPALAVVGNALLSMMTSSVLGGHPPLEIVHLNVALVPTARPVTVVIGEVALVIVAAPAITVHAPVPTPGVLAAMVNVLVLHCVMSAPAAETVGDALLVNTTSS